MEKNQGVLLSKVKSKIEKWCVYRDRCHFEVSEKLKEFGLNKEEAELLTANLIENNFLNEQRFADSFVSGKFSINKWGRNKIIIHLKQKRVSEKYIENALKLINEDDYLIQLETLAEKKRKESKGTESEIKIKIQRFLAAKGYEFDLIRSIVEKISGKQSK